MADNIALDALKRYLNGAIDLDALEYRIIPLAWDNDFEDQELIGELFIEIAYINDGVSDEDIFRERVSKIARARIPAAV
ncbi:MAG: hypothetical protein F4Y44_02800 [Chloroflexi bacterium]|nr:hypothetical protein [Chloroflexota bacterium]